MGTNRINSRKRLKYYCILLVIVMFGTPVVTCAPVIDELSSAFIEGFNKGVEEGRNDAKDIWEHPGKKQDKEQESPLTIIVVPILVIAFIFAFIAFWVYFVYVISNVNRGNVLEWCVPTGLKYMGYFLIAHYFIIFAIWIFDGEHNWEYLCVLPSSILIFGCGLLMTGDVIEMARKMKQEQDLTI